MNTIARTTNTIPAQRPANPLTADRELSQVISDSLNELKAVTARRRVRLPRHPQ